MIDKAAEKKLIDNGVFMSAVNDILTSGTDVKFTVTGMSMWPFLTSRRDSVTVRRCDFKDIKKGDIVLFSPVRDCFILHRVIRKNNDSFITAGDSNTFRDGSFTADTIIAKVTEITRKNKVIPVSSKAFSFMSHLWIFLFPARKMLLKILSFIIKHKSK